MAGVKVSPDVSGHLVDSCEIKELSSLRSSVCAWSLVHRLQKGVEEGSCGSNVKQPVGFPLR